MLPLSLQKNHEIHRQRHLAMYRHLTMYFLPINLQSYFITMYFIGAFITCSMHFHLKCVLSWQQCAKIKKSCDQAFVMFARCPCSELKSSHITQPELIITITFPCNVDPITSRFYKVKLGCTGVYIIFLIFALKHRLWVLF